MAEGERHILLIDDDIDDQEIFAIALKKIAAPAKCQFANDGILALRKLRSETGFIPDIIFVDINMPKMDGMECLVELKKITHLKQVPVYMYSTAGDPKMIAQSKSLGAEDFIQKQVYLEDLELLLAETLSKHNLLIR